MNVCEALTASCASPLLHQPLGIEVKHALLGVFLENKRFSFMDQMHIFPFPEYGNARRHPKAHLQAGVVHTAAAAYSKLSIYIAHKKAPFQWGKRERKKIYTAQPFSPENKNQDSHCL